MSFQFPMVNLKGIDDQTLQVSRQEVAEIPLHCPLFFGFAAMGDSKATFLNPEQFVKKHGTSAANGMKTDLFHPWMPYIETALQQTQTICYKRLRPDDASTSGMSWALDILETDVPIYVVDEDGQFIRDEDGNKVQEGTRTAPGLKVIPRVVMLAESDFGVNGKIEGQMEENGVKSTLYFIADFQASSFGSDGDLTGIRTWTRTTDSIEPVDPTVIHDQRTLLYGFEIVKKPDVNKSPVPWLTKNAERRITMSFKPDAIDPNYDQELFVDTVLDNHYRDVEVPAGFIPDNGPLRDIHVYHDNVAEVLALMQSKEAPVNQSVSADPRDIYLFNLLAPHDENNVPYRTIMFEDSLTNKPEFTETQTHYMKGGSNGDTSIENWHRMVEEQFTNFGQLDDTFMDVLRYPFSDIYDPGFNRSTKDALINVLRARKEVCLNVSTVIHGKAKPTPSQEFSLGLSLQAGYRLIPESIDFNTQTCNVEIYSQQARPLSQYSTYKGMLPMTYEWMVRRCRYMGSNNGQFRSKFAYDEGEQKVVTYQNSRDLDYTWLPDKTYNQRWLVGINDPRTWDAFDRAFYPSAQTIYSFSDSVLNNDINVRIMNACKRTIFRVWTMLVGNTKLSQGRFIEKSNEMIRDELSGRFDGRTVIIPETFFDSRRNAWNTRLKVGAQTAPLVNDASIVAYPLEELLSSSQNT